jgi:very-short-patch-repair endonuclease
MRCPIKQGVPLSLGRPSLRSCAKDQLWVVHSLNHETDLKPGDLRRRLIEHALDPGASTRTLHDAQRRTESEFEKQVLVRLTAAGYRMQTQWPVGAYRIDRVAAGNGKRLAIECDGDRWHPVEQIPKDMERQAILERLGWRFVRLRGTEFFRDPENAMRPIFQRLAELEIQPEGTADNLEPVESELKQRVIRHAEALRREWAKPEQMELEL